MISLVVLVVVTLISRVLGFVWDSLDSWLEAVRLGLAAMLIITGLSHFSKLREDFVRMVPPIFPAPDALVALTGVLELLGAIGLLIAPLRLYAALGLVLLLVAMLPANVYAARRNIPLADRPPTPLPLRVPLQILYLTLLLWVAFN